MIIKRTIISLVLAAVGAITLASCSASPSSNIPAGSLNATATPKAAVEAIAAQSFNAGGFLGGNAKPTLPAGESNKVSVISQGAMKMDGVGGGSLLFAFRNNTAKPVSHVDFTGTATAGGKIVASGQSQGTIPAQVQPGEAGFAYIYFSDTSSIPASGTTYDFKSSTSPSDPTPYNTAPLTVRQADNNGTSIIGRADNNTGKPLTGPYSVAIYCLDGDTLADEITGYATESGDIEAGAPVSFSVDLFDRACTTFVVGVSGYFK